jgi:dynein heavy chain
VFALSFFHTVLAERRHYGSLGFNIPYVFSQADLMVSVKQLRLLFASSTEIPWRLFEYLVGEVNYGGRITDDWDRRLVSAILRDIVSPEALVDLPLMPESGLELMPPHADATMKQHLLHIDKFPVDPPASLFGLHLSADDTFNLEEARQFLETLRTTGAGTGISAEEQTVAMKTAAVGLFHNVRLVIVSL